MLKSKTIALVEIAGSHDECLLSQMHAIVTAGHNVLLVTTSKIADRNPIFNNYVSETYIFPEVKGLWSRYRELKKVWRFLKTHGAEKVVLNTAQGSLVRILTWIGRHGKIEFTGIIHHTKKFEGSLTHNRIAKRVKKFFLLSEHLMNKVAPLTKSKLEYFYPIRFHGAEDKQQANPPIITIIGELELKRKDLHGLLVMMEKTKDLDYQIVFLGKSNLKDEAVTSFLREVEARGMKNRLKYFDEFVEQSAFSKILNETSFICPLVHPNTISAEHYFKNQISGAMSVAFGYKIPMLIHEEYGTIQELKEASFLYNMENVHDAFVDAFTSASLKREEMMKNERYSVEANEKRYTDFLFQEAK